MQLLQCTLQVQVFLQIRLSLFIIQHWTQTSTDACVLDIYRATDSIFKRI